MSQQINGSRLESLSREDVLTGVCTELAELGLLPSGQIGPDLDLTFELDIDSLDALSILLALNDRFGIDLPETLLSAIRTPKQIVDAIMVLIEAKEHLPVPAVVRET